jgi:hypothetical protein
MPGLPVFFMMRIRALIQTPLLISTNTHSRCPIVNSCTVRYWPPLRFQLTYSP